MSRHVGGLAGRSVAITFANCVCVEEQGGKLPMVVAGAGGVAEDLSAVLAGGCPSFFKEDDKTFYEASGKLQRAEATRAASERAHLTREALRLMMKARPPTVLAFNVTLDYEMWSDPGLCCLTAWTLISVAPSMFWLYGASPTFEKWMGLSMHPF